MKISILLPYKENFSPNYAGAVSLFVRDTTLQSTYKDHITIYGNTHYKKKLLSSYVNLKIDKKFFQSGSKIYVDKFLKEETKMNSDLIEVHNRPNYIKSLYGKSESKLILYFHNDPLTMNGSKSIKDRIFLLKNTHKIIFNSIWSKDRFFVNFKEKNLHIRKIAVVYQSAKKTKVNIKKKEKIITFVGKLNKAKGYDLFGKAIIKILEKNPSWKSIVVGDEPREKHFFNHKRLKIYGFQKHASVMKIYARTSIAVICSRWEEPFGRTSLEASSKGCAVIISNKGGLPETTNYPLILKKLTVSEIYNKINYLISNPKKRAELQYKNFKNFKYTHEYISNIIDNIRKKILIKFNINLRNNYLNTRFKILHITNFNDRHDGRLHYNTGRRINNGFIRLGHNVLTISDRDYLSQSKSFKDFTGKKKLDDKILNSFKNFKPDLIVTGHADSVSPETLDLLKSKNKDLKNAQWFLDPVTRYGPDFLKNKKRILDKAKLCDANFLTTDPKSLDFNINNAYFMPNPCDKSFETLSNYNSICQSDVFFAMSHGVHRGGLKRGKKDDREIFINKLITKNKDIFFDVYGMNNRQPIWGQKFLDIISDSKMGLNLSRGGPVKYYSSDRLAQLIGNGLLTFIDENTLFNDFLSKNEVVYYKGLDDLSDKINRYKYDHKERIRIAKNGKAKYLKEFNSTRVADYLLTKTFDIKKSTNYIWEK